MKTYNDALIAEYQSKLDAMKKLEKEIDAIKKEFFESQGGESESFMVTLKDNYRESVASKAVFEEKFGADFLRKNDLLKLSVFQTVIISMKNKQAA
jgi:hypothetical protein